MKDRFDIPRSMHNTSEIVKLRRVIERIEKKLEKAFKILDANDTKRVFDENETFKK
tara:strand:+ start:779 stop:946 length:168 start_codon:yes stop_codon:yes gene_type:complete